MVLLLRREGTHGSNQGGMIPEEMMMTEGVIEEMTGTEGGQVDWAVQGPQTTRPS